MGTPLGLVSFIYQLPQHRVGLHAVGLQQIGASFPGPPFSRHLAGLLMRRAQVQARSSRSPSPSMIAVSAGLQVDPPPHRFVSALRSAAQPRVDLDQLLAQPVTFKAQNRPLLLGASLASA